MKFNKLMFLILVAWGSSAWFGCTAGDPPRKNQDSGIDIATLDMPPGCTGAPLLPAPVIDNHPAVTNQLSQPFRGRAQGATSVVVSAADISSPASVDPNTGRFCIEANLFPDAVNTVRFFPRTADGCLGNTRDTTITHETSMVDGGVGPQVLNLAKNQLVTSSTAPDEGELIDVVDEDPNTHVRLDFWDIIDTGACDAYAWIKIDLGKVYTVSRVEIAWKPNVSSTYATCYGLLTSVADAPLPPDTSLSIWTEPVEMEDSGDNSLQKIVFNAQPVRHIAVLLYENGGTGFEENFDIGDIAVFGFDPNLGGRTGDSCQ